MRSLLIPALVVVAFQAQAQFAVDTDRSAARLVHSVLLGNSDVKVSNVNYVGDPQAIGEFINANAEDILPSGIILSTGYAQEATGGNHNAQWGDELGEQGDVALTRIAKAATYDAAILEFDLVPEFDSLYFEYCFGSEEYPEFVNKGKNDVFGFFLFGPEYPDGINLAKLEDGTPITINNINRHNHSEYYRINNAVEDPSLGKLIGGDARLYRNMQFDGFTTQLAAQARVTAGETYHLRIAIADAGDPLLDSGVFLKAKSFKSQRTHASAAAFEETRNNSEQSAETVETDVPASNDVPTAQGRVAALPTVYFAHNSAELAPAVRKQLESAINWVTPDSDLSIRIVGHTDSQGNDTFNQELGMRRAKAVEQYLLSKGVPANKMSTDSMGETDPAAGNHNNSSRALNRRVELFLKRE